MPRPNRFDAIRPVTADKPAMFPVARLSTAALSIFNHAVATHRHLRPADCVLLTLYAQTAARLLSSKGGDEKMGRLLIAYGRALRINGVQAPKPPKRHDPGGFGVTWQQIQGVDDDDDEGDDDAETP